MNLESPTDIGEEQAAILSNLYVWGNGRELRRRGGTLALSDPRAPSTTPYDMLVATRILGTDYLIGLHGGNLIDWLGARVTLPGSAGHFATGIKATAAFLPDALYIGNGTAQNARFDGTNVRVVGVSDVPSGTTGSASGVGSLNGVYTYKITFFGSDGNDGQPSPATANITATSAGTITLSNIPTAPAADQAAGRHIWRTISGGTTWYLVGTINNNTSTGFADTTADANVDTSNAISEDTVRFPPCQILVAHQLRLCGVLCNTAEGDNRTLYVSDFQRPWSCPLVSPLDEVDDPTLGIRIPLPEQPTGLTTYGDSLVVWFPSQAWVLRGDNPNNWAFQKWLDVGCLSHETAHTHKTALLWLAGDGVWIAQGDRQGVQVQRVSDDIRAGLEAISATDFTTAHGFVWEDRYYLILRTRTFYFDFRGPLWGEITAWPWNRSTVLTGSSTSKERIYAAKNSAGQVWQLETGTTDNGATIPVAWRSRAKDMGQFGRDKRVQRVLIRLKAGAGTCTLRLYRGSGELLDTFTKDISQVNRPGSTVSELDDRPSEGARDEFFALDVRHSDLSDDFRILDAGLFYTLAS